MSPSKKFSEVLSEWVGVFMRRSMRDFMYSMKDSGLSMPQLSTLMRLYYHENCGVSEIGSQLGVTNAAASQMIERLVRQELLERAEDPTDRRAKQLKLTPKGRALIAKAIEARRRWMEELTTALTREEQAAIITALTSLTEAARELEAEKPTKDEG